MKKRAVCIFIFSATLGACLQDLQASSIGLTAITSNCDHSVGPFDPAASFSGSLAATESCANPAGSAVANALGVVISGPALDGWTVLAGGSALVSGTSPQDMADIRTFPEAVFTYVPGPNTPLVTCPNGQPGCFVTEWEFFADGTISPNVVFDTGDPNTINFHVASTGTGTGISDTIGWAGTDFTEFLTLVTNGPMIAWVDASVGVTQGTVDYWHTLSNSFHLNPGDSLVLQDGTVVTGPVQTTPVAEPGTLALIAVGGVFVRSYRRRKSVNALAVSPGSVRAHVVS